MLKRGLWLTLFVASLMIISCREEINTSSNDGNGLVDPPAFGPSLSVVSPTEGDIWPPDTRHDIVWDVGANEFYVQLQLYRKSAFKLIIADSIANTGYYSWRIPAGIDQSHHYRIHIVYPENSFQSHYISDEFGVLE